MHLKPHPRPLRAFVDRFRAVLQLDDTPRSIAAGIFWGTLIAWTPTVGAQMLMAAVWASLLRVNRLAAVVMVWLSNPLTFLPMYWVEYLAGERVLTAVGVAYEPWTRERFVVVIDTMVQQRFLDALHTLGQAGVSLFGPMMAGGLLLGVVNGVALALPVHRYLTHRRDLTDAARTLAAGAGEDEP